jgi:hypothetical protein
VKHGDGSRPLIKWFHMIGYFGNPRFVGSKIGMDLLRMMDGSGHSFR